MNSLKSDSPKRSKDLDPKMEENTVPLTHQVDNHPHAQLSFVETESLTTTRPGQRQVQSTNSTDPLREEVSMLKMENMRLMQQRENLITDLEECKSDLFKRMPPNQISDGSVGKALERIRESIDDFVFDTMGDVAHDVLYTFCQRKQQKRKQKSRKPRNSLNNFIMKQDIKVWGPYECSNFYILSVIIEWVLEEYVFKSKYPMGITEEQKTILEEVERGMSHASRMQKPERFNVWRSDTLTALTMLRENEPRLERAAKEICSKLTDILSPWLFEAGPFFKVEARFKDEILVPAIKLHQDIKSASHQYETKYLRALDRLSPKQMLDEWDLKDANTWQKVRVERDVGRALYCLHPLIIRLRAESTSPIVVAKPVIVVEGPNREILPDPRELKDNPLNSTTAPPVATEPSPAVHHFTSSSKQGNPAQVKFAESSSTFIDSDSSRDSSRRRRRLSLHQSRRASTHPFTNKHEEPPSGPPPRQLSVPVDPFAYHRQEDRSSAHHHHYHYPKPHDIDGGERQPFSGKSPKADPQDGVLPYTRGHWIDVGSYPHQSPQNVAGSQQPSRKSSRDASGRSLGEMMAQPPSARASSVSPALSNYRGLKRFFGRQ